MRDDLGRRLNRAKYAAIGAAAGAVLGGLIGREAASTGASLGGLAGAGLGENRTLLTYEELQRKKRGMDSLSTGERWLADAVVDLLAAKDLLEDERMEVYRSDPSLD